MEFYRRAIALNARDNFYLLNLGDSSRRLGRAADADAAYRSGMDLALNELKQNPRNGYTRAFVGYFAARLGHRSAQRMRSDRRCNSPRATAKSSAAPCSPLTRWA